MAADAETENRYCLVPLFHVDEFSPIDSFNGFVKSVQKIKNRPKAV